MRPDDMLDYCLANLPDTVLVDSQGEREIIHHKMTLFFDSML